MIRSRFCFKNHSTCGSVVKPVSPAGNIVFMTSGTDNVAWFADVIVFSVTTRQGPKLRIMWHGNYVSIKSIIDINMISTEINESSLC